MNVSPVNFAGTTSQVSKKKNPVKTGAKVGAGVGLAISAVNTFSAGKVLKTFIKDASEQLGRNKAVAASVAGVAIVTAVLAGFSAAIGAGVGAIVKAVKKEDAIQ